MVTRAADGDGMHVHDLRKPSGCGTQSLLDAAIFDRFLLGLLDGGRLAFDVREHGIDLRNAAPDLRLKVGDECVRLAERPLLFELNMEFDAATGRDAIGC